MWIYSRKESHPNPSSGHPEKPHPYVDVQLVLDKGGLLSAYFLIARTKRKTEQWFIISAIG